MDKIGDIISIIFGLIFVVFSKKVSFFATERWEFFVGTKISEKLYQAVLVLIGILIIITGIIDLLR